ncbi:carnitine O-acetyltransferase-like [Centruroides vittatus]|uniref:carnitine O-acetyltransferase-like n=1 Tax=Centruroides vittatus TaxID=120091 RepID=UPI00350EB15E
MKTFKLNSACKLLTPIISKRCRSTASPFPSPFPKHNKGPMTEHQKDLPRQPVPPLKPSLNKYLKSVKPLLTQDEFRKTQKLVNEFALPGGVGEKLHSILIERYNELDNWIEDWWLELDFLKNRSPLTTYTNPGLAISCENFNSIDDQIRFSAKVLSSTLKYKQLVNDHQLEPDKLRGIPMDMSQYFKAFSSCRLPGKFCDRLEHYGEDDCPPSHIVVARNNKFFRVDVYDYAGNPLSENSLLEQLRIVVKKSETEGVPVGVLTTNYREIWSDVYDKLCKDSTNKKNLDTIQRALFVFSLDKAISNVENDSDKWTSALQNAIHGHGSHLNSGNRWMDKTFHLIVSEDGAFGLNMEHSPVEAHPLLRMTDYILDDLKTSQNSVPYTCRTAPEPQEIIFNINDDILNDIERAKENVDKCCEDADLSCLAFPNYGSQFLKSKKISTDSFIQMALQLAFYRLHGLRGVLYEVATLHSFLYGRMEIVHTTSEEAVNFCKIMNNKNASKQEKHDSLHKALKVHKFDVNEALRGNGIECLMVGLKKAAVESGMNVPDIYNDIGFESFSNYRLVSSQAPVRNPVFPSYGPLVYDGYGCPYYVYPDHLRLISLSLKQSPETNSDSLLKCVEMSLSDMENII